MTLSDLVQEYRREHGLSQRQFASICGLSNGYISMLERNVNPKTGQPVTPSLPALKKIADGQQKNMVIEYDDAKEAKKRYDSLRNFRSTNKLQGVFDMYRTEKTVCIIKVKKPPAKRG